MLKPQSSDDGRSSLLRHAVSCLNRQPYFRQKLHQKLLQRAQKLKIGQAEEIIKAILDDLQASGYLNDEYLAGAFVRRQLSKGYGPQLITLKLRSFNLSSQVLSSALAEAGPEAQLEAVKKYLRKYSHLDKYQLTHKLYQRGFAGSVINKLFDSRYTED